jgi:hypothetical protein
MPDKKKIPDQVFAHKSVHIAPLDCGSTVSYRLSYHGYFTADIDLSDCSRKITWSFGRQQHDIEKIDNAIKALQAFKKDYLKTLKLLPEELS